MIYFIAIVTIVVAYLLGSVSSSVLISKKISGKDIRESGSGNAGATNMLRVHGKKAAIFTLICDVLKGVIAVIIGYYADKYIISQLGNVNSPIFGNLRYIAGLFAVLGHDFPIFFGFKGGKGVATSLGVMLATDWKIGLIVAIISIMIMLLSHYVSLGSIIGGVLYPLCVLIFMIISKKVRIIYLASAIILGAIVIVKHHANIKRLISGTENKLSFKKGEK